MSGKEDNDEAADCRGIVLRSDAGMMTSLSAAENPGTVPVAGARCLEFRGLMSAGLKNGR